MLAVLKDCIQSPCKLLLWQVHHTLLDTTNTSVIENQHKNYTPIDGLLLSGSGIIQKHHVIIMQLQDYCNVTCGYSIVSMDNYLILLLLFYVMWSLCSVMWSLCSVMCAVSCDHCSVPWSLWCIMLCLLQSLNDNICSIEVAIRIKSPAVSEDQWQVYLFISHCYSMLECSVFGTVKEMESAFPSTSPPEKQKIGRI